MSNYTGFRRVVLSGLFCLVAMAVCLVVPSPAHADTGGYPYANYSGPGTDASQWIWTDGTGQWYSTRYRFAYRNCTDYVAWKLDSSNDWYVGVSMGHAFEWKAWALSRGYKVDDMPVRGAVAWWGGHSWNGGYGHVAYVLSVSGDGLSVELGEYNFNLDGKFSTRTIPKDDVDGYIHFKDLEDSSDSAPPSGSVGQARFLGGNTLVAGQRMFGEQYIASGNGRYVLKMQNDGNLVLYGDGFQVLWRTNTSGHAGAYLGLQNDGNVVLYTAGQQSLWATGPRGIARLVMQDDGNLVARNAAGSAVWASNTGGHPTHTYRGTDQLMNGQQLHANQYLRSLDRRYFLLMQSDGNLVLYSPGYHVLWSSGTSGRPGAYVGVQSDGNVVVYQSGAARWAADTTSANRMVVQPDGNLVARNADGAAVWGTNTAGRI